MTTKDTKQKTKTSLMDELKSIKGVLDTDDDNVPLLLDDDDIPVLEGDDDSDIPILADDDVPVLTSSETIANKSSLDAAIRQLESMELSPKANKVASNKAESLEEKIRNNAAPPLFEDKKFDDKATTVRENPFLNKKPTDRFSESRKQAEEALQSVIAHSRAGAQSNKAAVFESKQPTATPIIEDHPADSPIDFTDNQFLKASSAPIPVTGASSNKSSPPAAAVKEKEDGSDDILKLLDEDSGLDLDLGDDFGDLVDIDVDALISEKPTPKPLANKQTATKSAVSAKPTVQKVDQLVDEVIDEYLTVLEAALKKKLKTQINQIVDEVGDEYMVILEAALKKKLQGK